MIYCWHMRPKNIFEITDVTEVELEHLIKRTLYFSKNIHRRFTTLKHKRIGLLFDSNSLRTKLSFEVAVDKLGGYSYFVPIHSVTHEQDRTARECFEDIIDTMDRYVDAYVVRDYSREVLDVLARKNDPPIINGFSEVGHPSQALADVSVIMQKRGSLEDLHICAVGPAVGSGVIESFIYAVLMLGHDVTMITPTGTMKGKNKDFHQVVAKLKGNLTITKDTSSTKKADVLYVDEWWENKPDFTKKKPPKAYRVDEDFVKGCKKDLLIMHCLPAHHDREIARSVIYSDRSIVFDEAEFRIYSAMAWLEYMRDK